MRYNHIKAIGFYPVTNDWPSISTTEGQRADDDVKDKAM